MLLRYSRLKDVYHIVFNLRCWGTR